jgi:hypothetical protein
MFFNPRLVGRSAEGGSPEVATRRRASAHARKVDRDVECDFHVFGEEVERDVGDNLDDLLFVEACLAKSIDIGGLATEVGVSGEAVIAVVAVRDCHGDLFAELGTKTAFAERAEGGPHAGRGRRRIRHRPEHVRYHAEGPLDLCKLARR